MCQMQCVSFWEGSIWKQRNGRFHASAVNSATWVKRGSNVVFSQSPKRQEKNKRVFFFKFRTPACVDPPEDFLKNGLRHICIMPLLKKAYYFFDSMILFLWFLFEELFHFAKTWNFLASTILQSACSTSTQGYRLRIQSEVDYCENQTKATNGNKKNTASPSKGQKSSFL